MGSALGRRRAHSDSRLGITFRALVFFALVAGVAFVTRPLWSPSSAPSLSVRYRTGDHTSAAVSQPWLQVVNTSQKPVPLSQVTLRYYFTQEGSAGYTTNCIYAAVGCTHISESIVTLSSPTPGADHYLQISFASGAGDLAPKANSGSIELQLYQAGGTAMNQANDRSYDSADSTAYRENKLVTAYVDGTLAWGQDPPGAGAAASTAAAAPLPTAPQAASKGVYFDDFHYTGPGDPALNKHGWMVRTVGGGPGVLNTWRPSGVSFPSVPGAQGGQVLNLRATTNGKASGTTQAEIQSDGIPFFTGTYAARIHFEDQPTRGRNGDPINEDFYMISPDNAKYSEMDAEYEPNGGWGAPGPRLDTTTWFSADTRDRITRKNMISLNGWHTLVITAAQGVVSYYMDGNLRYTTTGKYYPREPMSANFNTWFVNLPFSGNRQWDMQVNWFYYNAQQTMTPAQVQQSVDGLYAGNTHFVNTVGKN